MNPDFGAGRDGPDLSRLPLRTRGKKRGPVAALLTALVLTLVPGGVLLLPGGRHDAPHTAPAVTEVVARQATAAPELSFVVAQRYPSSDPVSHMIRRPLRVTDRDARHHDVRALTRQVLAGFGHVVTADDPLQRLLVHTLAQGQSDAYVDAALNAAASRGEFRVPAALRTISGAVDTARLLAAFLDGGPG